MEFRATQKYIRMSPRKLQLVAQSIRTLSPVDAMNILPHAGKRAALPLLKVVMTAVANAKQKGVDQSELIFKEIQVNQGPKMKRFRAGARGRAKPYERIMSHVRVVVATKPAEVKTKHETKAEEKKEVKKTEKKDTKKIVKSKTKKGNK